MDPLLNDVLLAYSQFITQRLVSLTQKAKLIIHIKSIELVIRKQSTTPQREQGMISTCIFTWDS